MTEFAPNAGKRRLCPGDVDAANERPLPMSVGLGQAAFDRAQLLEFHPVNRRAKTLVVRKISVPDSLFPDTR